jgi:hypothetical protein
MLKELLKMCLQSSKITFLVLDGLDECKKGEGEKAILWFTSLLEEINIANSGSIRLLCASQRDGVLDKALSKASIISLDTVEHQKDIELYTRQWSAKIQRKFNLDSELEQDIAMRVSQSAAGKLIFSTLY